MTTQNQNRDNQFGRFHNAPSVTFTFDGKKYQGKQGENLTASFIANNILLCARSFKYRRPRGPIAIQFDEPNALVSVIENNNITPNTKLSDITLREGLIIKSQNKFPSLKFDIGDITTPIHPFIKAGFYYKTFMGPTKFAWQFWEYFIRKAAGLGKASLNKNNQQYENCRAHPHNIIIGGGPAGMHKALTLARHNPTESTWIIDNHNELGGNLLALDNHDQTKINNQNPEQWRQQTLRQLKQQPNITILNNTTVTHWLDDGFILAIQHNTNADTNANADTNTNTNASTSANTNAKPLQEPTQTLWRLRAKKHITLATGATERPLLFPDNDRPGIMLADTVRQLLLRYGVRAGNKILFATDNDSAYRAALTLNQAGAHVTICDTRTEKIAKTGKQYQKAQQNQLTILTDATIVKTTGRQRVRKAEILAKQRKISIACDLIASSGGWNPLLNLWSQARGTLKFDNDKQMFLAQDKPPSARHGGSFSADIAGAATGTWGLKPCLDTVTNDEDGDHVSPTLNTLPPSPHKTFIDLQNDVTIADIKLAHSEGYQSVEHLKRYTTTGMGTDQGKTSAVNALRIRALLSGKNPDSHTSFRPPFVPLSFGAIAGARTNNAFHPIRQTPLHAWHTQHNAVFEDVGDWKRAYYYPQHNENKHQAVRRECYAVRNHVGIFDGSTLGKIDIQGRDSAKLLNLIYTNGWSQLAPGRCRYGLMLNEHGMIFDDGVTSCLDKNHYHMTTTTGGAATVLDWIERWLQTEWPQLEVFPTSVTEQWAVIALAGPNAQKTLQTITATDLNQLPFMAWQHATIQTQSAPIQARIFRISFSGELAYEINVPWHQARATWEQLVKAGENHNITPYGTEAMHVLRAEKGYIIVGQETDGTTTPDDVGLNAMVSQRKDFIGKRSLIREHTATPGRRQLVGFRPLNKKRYLKEGTPILNTKRFKKPIAPQGHVSSSYFSPTLDGHFGLAMVANGRARLGQTLYAVRDNGSTVPIALCSPVFYDPENKRRDGENTT